MKNQGFLNMERYTPFKFRWTKKHEEFCLDNRIYLKHIMQIKKVYECRNLFLFKRGTKISINAEVNVESYSTMPLNSFCSMGSFSYCVSSLPNDVVVGRFCSIAKNLNIMGTQHPIDWYTSSPVAYKSRFIEIIKKDFEKEYSIHPFDNEFLAPPVIGNDVWIGENVTLKGGISIGNGAIIASNSVVTKDIPPYAIYGGVPAKLIKYRFDKSLIDKLEKSQWWNYNIADLPANKYADQVDLFLQQLDISISKGIISQYKYKKHNLSKAFWELSQ